MPELQRLREKTTDGWVIHADAPAGAATLCGFAYRESGVWIEEVARGKINCGDCLRIIWHCQDRIPKRVLAPDGRPLYQIVRAR